MYLFAIVTAVNFDLLDYPSSFPKNPSLETQSSCSDWYASCNAAPSHGQRPERLASPVNRSSYHRAELQNKAMQAREAHAASVANRSPPASRSPSGGRSPTVRTTNIPLFFGSQVKSPPGQQQFPLPIKSSAKFAGGDSLRLPYRTSASDFLGPEFTRRLEQFTPGIAPGTQLASFISEPPPLRTAVSSPPHSRPSNLPQGYQSYSPNTNTLQSSAGSGLGELSNLHAVLQEIKRELGSSNASTPPSTLTKSSSPVNLHSRTKSPSKQAEYSSANGSRDSRHVPVISHSQPPSIESPPHRAFRLLGLLPEPDTGDDDPRARRPQQDSHAPQPLHRHFQQQLSQAVHDESEALASHRPDSSRTNVLRDWQHLPTHPAEASMPLSPVPAYHVVASPVQDMPRMEQDGMHVSNTPQQYQYAIDGISMPHLASWHHHDHEPDPAHKLAPEILASPPAPSSAALSLPDVVPQWNVPSAPHREEPASDPAPFTPQRSARSFRSDLTDALSRDSREAAPTESQQASQPRFREPKTPPEPEHEASQEPALQDTSDMALLAAGSDYEDQQHTVPQQEHEQQQPDLHFGPMDPVGVRLTLDEDYDELIPSEAGRLRFERLIEEELCEALGLPAGRIQVACVERGSVIVKLNLWPDPAGREQSPSGIADEIVRQCGDPHSRIMRGICVRRLRSAIKEAPYIGAIEPPQDSAPTTLRRQTDNQHAEKIAMFKEFEKAAAKIPQPQPLSANKGPHFTAPKAALQAHVQRERRISTTPRSASSSRIEDSTFPNITTATDMTVSSPGSILTHTNNMTIGSPWAAEPAVADTPSHAHVRLPSDAPSIPAPVPPTPVSKPDAPKLSARIASSPSMAAADVSADDTNADASAADDSSVSLSASKFGVKLKHVGQNREAGKVQYSSQPVSRNLTSLLAADEAAASDRLPSPKTRAQPDQPAKTEPESVGTPPAGQDTPAVAAELDRGDTQPGVSTESEANKQGGATEDAGREAAAVAVEVSAATFVHVWA
jgi:hypothetical protein